MRAANLQLDYASSDELRARAAGWWRGVLGIVGFDAIPRIDGAPVPAGWSVTPSVDAPHGHHEVWRVAGTAGAELDSTGGRRGDVEFRHQGGWLFGAITVEERRQSGGSAGDLERAVRGAYLNIFEVIEFTGHPHLLRVWNTVPEINAAADGDERYRHFNAARQAAFLEAGRDTVGSVPAASAVGSLPGSPISIYFLASAYAPTAIENPRQVSAYHYPPRYGRRSPTFSRASLLPQREGVSLFVSGTASIVGHESLHPGDVAAQTREALHNIAAVLGEANRHSAGAGATLGDLRYKVYLRRQADRPEVERELCAVVKGCADVVYLRADVCRDELLVEIEAVGQVPGAAAQIR